MNWQVVHRLVVNWLVMDVTVDLEVVTSSTVFDQVRNGTSSSAFITRDGKTRLSCLGVGVTTIPISQSFDWNNPIIWPSSKFNRLHNFDRDPKCLSDLDLMPETLPLFGSKSEHGISSLFAGITCSTFFVVASPGKVVVGVGMCHPNFKACKPC